MSATGAAGKTKRSAAPTGSLIDGAEVSPGLGCVRGSQQPIVVSIEALPSLSESCEQQQCDCTSSVMLQKKYDRPAAKMLAMKLAITKRWSARRRSNLRSCRMSSRLRQCEGSVKHITLMA